MKMKAIMKMAQDLGVENAQGMDKPELILAIQQKEGFSPCYATAQKGSCDQEACLWYDDCMEDSRAVELSV